MPERTYTPTELACLNRQMDRIADHYLGTDGRKAASPGDSEKMLKMRIALRARADEDTLYPKAAKDAVAAAGLAGINAFNEYKICVRGGSVTAPVTPNVAKPAASAASATTR